MGSGGKKQIHQVGARGQRSGGSNSKPCNNADLAVVLDVAAGVPTLSRRLLAGARRRTALPAPPPSTLLLLLLLRAEEMSTPGN